MSRIERRARSAALLPAFRILGRIVPGLCLLFYVAVADARAPEYDSQSWDAAGTDIKVFTYRPSNCQRHDILFVFHGLNRKAEGVRDKAAKVARKACLMVFSPLFDKDRFPTWRYHRAGVVRKGRIQPRARWTEPIFRALLQQARGIVDRDDTRLYLFGHSAGGHLVGMMCATNWRQFLSRISAYSSPFDADRILVANPSVHVVPSVEEKAPYGFGGLFSSKEAKSRIEHYLALPITVYLGDEDTRSKNLVTNESANRQGANRLERGRNIFSRAKRLAEERNWQFNWRLVEARSVGHSSRGMLQAPEFITALGLDEEG